MVSRANPGTTAEAPGLGHTARGAPYLWANGFGDVAKRVDGGAADGLLVCLQHVQQLKADAHPLARRHVARTPVGDAPHQVNAVLLHLLVSACMR